MPGANDYLSAGQFHGSNPHIQCEHCGRMVPEAETSEGMCSTCGNDPISDAVRDLNRRRN